MMDGANSETEVTEAEDFYSVAAATATAPMAEKARIPKRFDKPAKDDFGRTAPKEDYKQQHPSKEDLKVREPKERPDTAKSTASPQKEILLPSQQKYEDKMKIIKNVESNLLSLQLEKKKLEEEYAKIVDKGAKTNAQRRRKDDLELELSILGKNISTLKQKLRDMNALHQEY